MFPGTRIECKFWWKSGMRKKHRTALVERVHGFYTHHRPLTATATSVDMGPDMIGTHQDASLCSSCLRNAEWKSHSGLIQPNSKSTNESDMTSLWQTAPRNHWQQTTVHHYIQFNQRPNSTDNIQQLVSNSLLNRQPMQLLQCYIGRYMKHIYTQFVSLLTMWSLSIEWVCKVERPTQHIMGHFGDESLQAINCTGTDNVSEQIGCVMAAKILCIFVTCYSQVMTVFCIALNSLLNVSANLYSCNVQPRNVLHSGLHLTPGSRLGRITNETGFLHHF